MLSGTERVRLSRWVNKVEDVADQLLELLRTPPEPLPRDPVFDPDLLSYVARFSAGHDNPADDDDQFPPERFLELGNGHQSKNRDRAMAAVTQLLPGVRMIDKNTVEVGGIGRCHFAAFSHPKGAMISSTRMTDTSFGGAEWHSKERIMMFRDVGDGRCFVYVCRIEPLFQLRSIGHHGVRWEDVRDTADRFEIIRSVDALQVAPM